MRIFVLLCSAALLTACSDNSQDRLAKALAPQGIRTVAVTDATVTATCTSGETVDVPTSELERGLLGVKPENIQKVGQKILKLCEEKDVAKRKAEAARARVAEEAKKLGIAADGVDEETLKKKICDMAVTRLPLKDPERALEAQKNTREFGCPPPPPPAEVATGLWQVDPGKAGSKPLVQYLRLENDDGDKLTLRCRGGKPEVYAQPKAVRAKKGAKLAECAVDGKEHKWKITQSKNGDAVFFADAPAALRVLKGAESFALDIPQGKKSTTVSFHVKGMATALAQLDRKCGG